MTVMLKSKFNIGDEVAIKGIEGSARARFKVTEIIYCGENKETKYTIYCDRLELVTVRFEHELISCEEKDKRTFYIDVNNLPKKDLDSNLVALKKKIDSGEFDKKFDCDETIKAVELDCESIPTFVPIFSGKKRSCCEIKGNTVYINDIKKMLELLAD